MKSESFPQLPENLPAPIYEVVHKISPMRKAESFHLTDVGKAEPPFLMASAPCEETARPGRETAYPCIELNTITKVKSPESDSTEDQTGGNRKTGQRTSLRSEHKHCLKAGNPSSFGRDRFPYRFPTEAGRSVWFCSRSSWRVSALLRWARRIKHRWKRKR